MHEMAGTHKVSRILQITFTGYQYVICSTRNLANIAQVTRTGEEESYDNRSEWSKKASVYVHWPYCEKRCSYCNFNKYISSNVDHQRMKTCLVRETTTLLNLSQVSSITSIFFGGGTPSLANPDTLGAVIDTISGLTDLPQGAEITLEVNPTHAEKEKLKDFCSVGVNRLSIGVQSLRDNDLKELGRQHSVQEALRCVEFAHGLCPDRVSLDVIFGRPGQASASWKEELKEVLTVCGSHISLYQLTLERGTRLWKQVQDGTVVLPDDESMAEMYEIAITMLENAGLERYEASNFAIRGAESHHNKSYWSGDQYIGVGPGAHGRFVPWQHGGPHRQARIQTLEPEPWMREVASRGHGTRKIVTQSVRDILQEYLMLGLRTREGVLQKKWQDLGARKTLCDMFRNDDRVLKLISDGLLHVSGSGICASPKGLNVIDSILPHLLCVLDAQEV